MGMSGAVLDRVLFQNYTRILKERVFFSHLSRRS
jgi:hypothetical protein